MKRRRLLQYAAALPILPFIDRPGSAYAAPTSFTSRVRPGDPRWPTASEWESLRQSVAGDLITVNRHSMLVRHTLAARPAAISSGNSRTPTSLATARP